MVGYGGLGHKRGEGVGGMQAPKKGERGCSVQVPKRGERGRRYVSPNKKGELYEEKNVETSVKNFCPVYCIVDFCVQWSDCVCRM